jgi:ribosomal protein S18 acetylase RimI-like enzyme
MSADVELHRNRAAAAEVVAHLRACADAFVPPLRQRVDIDAYAAKIVARAERFEAWSGDELSGLVAAYCNDAQAATAFITSVSVTPAWQGRGLASRLLLACIEHVRRAGLERIELEVDLQNAAAEALYRKHGFAAARTGERTQILQLVV